VVQVSRQNSREMETKSMKMEIIPPPPLPHLNTAAVERGGFSQPCKVSLLKEGLLYIFISAERKLQLLRLVSLHRKKKVRKFSVPSRDVTTNLSLGGNNDVITELFLPMGSLASGIPAGDGKLVNLFYGVELKMGNFFIKKPHTV
jgi:hypothetical protein